MKLATTNETFERLLEASLMASAAPFAQALARESLLPENARRLAVRGLRRGEDLVIGADFDGEQKLEDWESRLGSESLIARLLAALHILKVCSDGVTTDTLHQLGNRDEVSAKVRLARRVCTDILVGYPFLLDPRIQLRLSWDTELAPLHKWLATRCAMRMPSRVDGYTQEQLVTFSTHRAVFTSLHARSFGLASLIKGLHHNPANHLACAGYLETYENARIGIKEGRKPKRLDPTLMGDDDEGMESIASAIGGLLLHANPMVHTLTNWNTQIDCEQYALDAVERLQRIRPDLMDKALQGFLVQMRELAYSKAIDYRHLPELAELMTRVGIAPSHSAAGMALISVARPESPPMVRREILPRGSGALLVEGLKDLCTRFNLPQPFIEFHTRARACRDSLNVGGVVIGPTETERRIELAANEQMMRQVIGKASADSAPQVPIQAPTMSVTRRRSSAGL